jgi:predicted nucleic acid-binding protein
MDGKPLSLAAARKACDRFFDDDRLTFLSEPPALELRFREKAMEREASPMIWADAWLLAVAQAAGGRLITLDRALGARDAHCLLGKRG